METSQTVTDPGFSRQGQRQPLSFGQKPIIWQDFCQKLHGNERNWMGAYVPSAPLDPPMTGSYSVAPQPYWNYFCRFS